MNGGGGSAKSSETDGYAKNVENLVTDKTTINTLKKINNGKPKNNNGNDLHEGARQVMNTITSKLIRHASDKITKHVGNIIRSSMSSKKSIAVENAQVRSPVPLSSATEVVLPAQAIAKLNEKGFDNTTLTANVKDLKSGEAAAGTSSRGEVKTNETTLAGNNATQITNSSQATNITSSASPENKTTNNNSSAIAINNSTANGTVSSSGNATKYSDIQEQPSAVMPFVSAPPIGPMESISIDLKGQATTYKNFSKVNKEPEIFRPSKTEILNFENNSVLSADNIVKRYIPKSSTFYEGPISNELESTLLVKRSPSKGIRSSLPFQPISSSRSSKLPSSINNMLHISRRSRTIRHKSLESRAFKDKDEGEDELGSSGESGDGDTEEIDVGQHRKYKIKPGGGKGKSRHHKLKKLSTEGTKKVSPIRKVPILTITTDDSIRGTHATNKVKKHKHKHDLNKMHSGFTEDTSSYSHQKKKRRNGNISSQTNHYKVYPTGFESSLNNSENHRMYTEPENDMGSDNLGSVSFDLNSLSNHSRKLPLNSHDGLSPMEIEDDHKANTGDDVTFTLGHNHMDELPKNLPEKDPFKGGSNHVGEPGAENTTPKDPLAAGHEQGPLLPGHEQGPLLIGQQHPGDFSHHENEPEDQFPQMKLQGEGLTPSRFPNRAKWNHHSQPSGPNIVEEPLQVPPVPAEINPGIPNAVSNFPSGPKWTFNLPSSHPILSLEGIVQPPLNSPALLKEEEKACSQHPPLSPHLEGSAECPSHHESPYRTGAEEAQGVTPTEHQGQTTTPTASPTLPFEIPSHHKFEKLGHNIEPELLSIIESNNQQVTSLSHEVKNIESRLGNVESIVEVLEKAVYRIEEKVDKLDHPVSTYTQREEFADTHVTEEPPHNPHHSPLLKQYFVPLSPGNNLEGIKEIDRAQNNGGLPWPVNKVVAYLLTELQKKQAMNQHSMLQLQSPPHVPLPQPEMAYPPKEHDIDRLEYEIGRTPKSKFGHKLYHYETLDNPCQCENGGECNGRSDGCECPLRFTGPRCERPVPRSSLLDSIIDEIPSDPQQQYHAPKKTSLITLPLVISENTEDQDSIAQKTVGEVNQSKLVNLLSQFFSPDYLQRFAKREKVTPRRYVKYPLEKEK